MESWSKFQQLQNKQVGAPIEQSPSGDIAGKFIFLLRGVTNVQPLAVGTFVAFIPGSSEWSVRSFTNTTIYDVKVGKLSW